MGKLPYAQAGIGKSKLVCNLKKRQRSPEKEDK